METPETAAAGPDPRRPPWHSFRAALDAAGFRPSKRLGQNFLLDGNMARSIARDAEVGAGDFVLEVGPGCGFLSVHLAALGVELHAVEIDRRLLGVARGFLHPFENVNLFHGDVLEGKHRLAPEVRAKLPGPERPWHLVSNLPYSISGPLVAVIARLEHPPASATVLVQHEVAERLAARPGERAYGALPAKLSPLYAVRAVRHVAAQLFWPRPRVESAVVRLELRSPPLPGADDLAAFDALLDALFQRRRKTVRSSLASLLGDRAQAEELLRDARIEPGDRPEEVRIESLWNLATSEAWRASSDVWRAKNT